MRALSIMLICATLCIAGCITPQQQEPPDAPQDGDDGDGLVIVAPGGGGESLGQRIDRIAD